MNNSIEIYRSQDGSVQLNVKLENDTIWLTQIQMAELFNRDRTKREIIILPSNANQDYTLSEIYPNKFSSLNN